MRPTEFILTAAEMRAAEAATAAAGTPLSTLMDRAGAALGQLALRIAAGRPVHVLAGPGNNGGDGYVAAHWLRAHGVPVTLTALADPASELCRAAADRWRAEGAPAIDAPIPGAIVIDALFGTGLNRPLDDRAAALLRDHAGVAARVIAADLPSGVDSDSGALLGNPAGADVTLAFAALKPAHLLFPAAARCGVVRVADIGITVQGIAHRAVMTSLPAPDCRSHKYRRGLVAVVAGAMPGAAELAARAAQRAGAGYVRLIGAGTPPSAPFALVRQSWGDGAALADARIGAVVIGPGLGQGERASERWAAALASGHPLVVDADALPLIAAPLGVPAILTPHAGEFARIGGDGDADKIGATRALAGRMGAVVVHKGPDTVIAAPDGRVAVHSPGDAWLSSAGTGDVLAGLCGAMLARGLAPFEAAQNAVLLHQSAARRAGAGLIADDLLTGPILP
jgi:hydroxyethylthiazole kinase-like uncharacterized protein yjeF